MKNLQDWNFASLGTIYKCLQALHKKWNMMVTPIRTMTEGFLNIDDKQCCGSVRHEISLDLLTILSLTRTATKGTEST
jgi:hypothetical protein